MESCGGCGVFAEKDTGLFDSCQMVPFPPVSHAAFGSAGEGIQITMDTLEGQTKNPGTLLTMLLEGHYLFRIGPNLRTVNHRLPSLEIVVPYDMRDRVGYVLAAEFRGLDDLGEVIGF